MTRLTTWIILLSALAVAWPDLAGAPPPNLDNTLEAQQTRISEDPRNPAAWNDLGNLLVLADRFADAEEAYRTSLDLAPNDTGARFNLALLLEQQGRLADAAEELEQLLSIDPRHAWAHYQLGVILAARKDRSGAIDHYARALAYDPSLSFAENNPHIIENPLFGEALIRSQRYLESSATRVPRVYGEPDRIVEMMLDLEMSKKTPAAEGGEDSKGEAGEPKGEEEDEEGEGTGTKAGGGANASFDAAPAAPGAERHAAAPGAPSERNSLEQLRSVAIGQAQPSPTAPGAATSRGSTSQATTSQGTTSSRSVTTRPPPARGRHSAPSADPRAADETRPTLRATPPPPTRSSRYLPGRRSTSQLDLRLLPEEEPPVRVASVDGGA